MLILYRVTGKCKHGRNAKAAIFVDSLDILTWCHVSKQKSISHDDVIKWKHFPRNWPFVRGIHRSPVNSQHKGQWRGALMFSLICVWINDWVNNREAGDLRRYRAHYDVIVMKSMLASKDFLWVLLNGWHLVSGIHNLSLKMYILRPSPSCIWCNYPNSDQILCRSFIFDDYENDINIFLNNLVIICMGTMLIPGAPLIIWIKFYTSMDK